MENRERYDPEDIESLLQERAFDELLDEERAYVLRHLNGRAEYEAMRMLLKDVRNSEEGRQPLTPDPDVRAAVLEAFRTQHRPLWRIWLNAVGQALWPKDAFALWRPALAIASLALLVMAGVQVVRHSGKGMKEGALAELKEEAAAKSDPVVGPAQAPGEAPSGPAGAPEKQASEAASAAQPSSRIAEESAETGLSEASRSIESPLTVPGAAASKEDAQAHLEPDAMAEAPIRLDSEATRESHTVTADELAVNMSLANATGAAAKASRKAADRKRGAPTLSDAPELLALMATGW
jgi:hypothetical protein